MTAGEFIIALLRNTSGHSKRSQVYPSVLSIRHNDELADKSSSTIYMLPLRAGVTNINSATRLVALGPISLGDEMARYQSYEYTQKLLEALDNEELILRSLSADEISSASALVVSAESLIDSAQKYLWQAHHKIHLEKTYH
jgi:hypothetical protein